MSLSRRDFLKGSAALGLLGAIGARLSYADVEGLGMADPDRPVQDRIEDGPEPHAGTLGLLHALNRSPNRMARVQLRRPMSPDPVVELHLGPMSNTVWYPEPGTGPVGMFEVWTASGVDGYLEFTDGTFQSFGTEGDEWWKEIA